MRIDIFYQEKILAFHGTTPGRLVIDACFRNLLRRYLDQGGFLSMGDFDGRNKPICLLFLLVITLDATQD
ncbi:hypothetical protein CSK29544_02555 [Cronobacter sakazakii]|nr:hypothetical protein CSK29544_02555 [Cronobacter sakazakii]